MDSEQFNDLCKRFCKLNLEEMGRDEKRFFLSAFASFLKKIEPLLDEYAPKSPQKPTEKYYRFGIDGKIEPLE